MTTAPASESVLRTVATDEGGNELPKNGTGTELAKRKEEEQALRRIPLPSVDNGPFANLLDTARFEHLWRIARLFAATAIIPAHLREKPEDCFVLIQMAIRLNVDPFMFLQKTYVVGGKPGIEAQLAIALVNSRGPFTGPIQWRTEGEAMAKRCTAFATHKITGEVCECTVSMEIARAEGWLGKNGSKWQTMPDQMLRYRSASWLARLYAPECLMGMETLDELEDVVNSERGRHDPATAALPINQAATAAARAADALRGNGTEPAPATPAKVEASLATTLSEGATKPKDPIAAEIEAEKAAALDCAVGKPGCSTDIGDFKLVNGKRICANHAPREGALPFASAGKTKR